MSTDGRYHDKNREQLLEIVEKLDTKQRLQAKILENVSDGIIASDAKFIVTSWNQSAEEIYGYTEQEAIGKTTVELVQPRYIGASRDEMMRSLHETGAWIGETIHHAKDGRELQIMASVKLLTDDKGEVVGAVTINRDIGKQKKIEGQLVQNERLASVGLLAAGVAHEINNPLTYVLYNLERLTEYFHATSSHLSHQADQALEGANRVKNIVVDLNTFSRTGDAEIKRANLNDVLDTALHFAGNEIKFRAKLKKEYGKLPDIMLSDGKLAQVFLNLLINAAHSIKEGDPLNNLITVRTWRDGERLAVSITDTGSGIPEGDLDHLFDPFFTTKSVGEGAGLGLTVCNNIVKSLGGSIDVASKVGEGSCFVVWHPCKDPGEEERISAISSTERPKKLKILVIDDEKLITDVVYRMLRSDHEVTIVNSGEAALNALNKSDDFDGILCDLMMPDIAGMDIHAWLVERGNPLADKMIFISGGAFTPNARDFFARVTNPKIQKPFLKKDLLDALNSVVC